VPYAILETDGDNSIKQLKEKPTYTYYSNGGIYLIKRRVLDQIPKGQKFDTTDLIEKLIAQGEKVVTFPMVDYWLDIGKHDDYIKANEDIRHLNLTSTN
jgi:NDP-sugar pyrophosphorylase family protein